MPELVPVIMLFTVSISPHPAFMNSNTCRVLASRMNEVVLETLGPIAPLRTDFKVRCRPYVVPQLYEPVPQSVLPPPLTAPVPPPPTVEEEDTTVIGRRPVPPPPPPGYCYGYPACRKG